MRPGRIGGKPGTRPGGGIGIPGSIGGMGMPGGGIGIPGSIGGIGIPGGNPGSLGITLPVLNAAVVLSIRRCVCSSSHF